MTLIQFFLTLFIFISLLAGSGVLVASICLMLRFRLCCWSLGWAAHYLASP